uniref:Gypsy retrotransposon integrase-like protein 1 n=1 Tax=Sphenodon punctatus TaxID=8508 RepID=A0A8D0HDL6_SPHPU
MGTANPRFCAQCRGKPKTRAPGAHATRGGSGPPHHTGKGTTESEPALLLLRGPRPFFPRVPPAASGASTGGKRGRPGGAGGHPARTIGPLIRQGAPVGDSPNHLCVPLTLQISGRRTKVIWALIDSGASGNFVDELLVRDLCLPLVAKARPETVYSIDGSPLSSGPVLYSTPCLQGTIGTHQEGLALDVVRTPAFPIVLGMPWLQAHNPSINWQRRCLKFDSPACRQHQRQAPVRKMALGVHELPSKGVRGLPAAYQDLQEAFKEQDALELPPHRSYDCPIELLPDAVPPYGRIYALSTPELQTLKAYVEENLAKGFIRPSTSPAGAPLFFVPKKDGGLRPCIDYRGLNALTIKNRYPLPLIPELLDRLQGASVFTKLDLRGAYNLLRIRAGDEWKTAFRTRYGLYEYLVMPYGLANAPATFQHLINDLFRDVLDISVVAYLDDILVFSRNLQEHVQHVRLVLKRLIQTRLYCKREKCLFHQQVVPFLGFIVSPKGIGMDPAKVQAIAVWPPPTAVKPLQRFLGSVNYYRQYIPQFARLTAPLTRLLKKGEPYQWRAEQQEAFRELKKAFTVAPILQHPDFSRPFLVETDASSVALGAVLSQQVPGEDIPLPCAFFSRQLTAAERNYTVLDRELLAIRDAFESWRHYLEGAPHPIQVKTDHKNLVYLQTARIMNARHARWALFFARFTFQISYRTGKSNTIADALSRYQETAPAPAHQGETICPPRAFAAAGMTLAQFKHLVQQDPSLPEKAPGTQTAELHDHHEVIVVPTGARHEVLRAHHDAPLAGHPGQRRTLQLIQRHFWWPTIRQDTRDYVLGCAVCSRTKSPRQSPSGLLQLAPQAQGPWQRINMDFIVELPPARGYTTILVVVDQFTKMGHFIPCKKLPTAQQTAMLVLKNIIRLHGLPTVIISDRGSQFIAHFWRALFSALEVKLAPTTAYHPQANGQAERTNQSLEQYLRCYVSYLQDDWVDYLALAEFAYNNAPHASIGTSPFHVNYGYHPRLFLPELPSTTVPAAGALIQTLHHLHSCARTLLQKARQQYKQQADRHRRPAPTFAPGDLVWVDRRQFPSRRPSAKLDSKYMGPFPILRQVNPVTYHVSLPAQVRCHPVFHVSLLKPAHPSPFPPSLPPPPVESIDALPEYEVRALLDAKRLRGVLHYLV